MYLKRLSLINFKNIGQEEFPLTPGINCFVGDNGAVRPVHAVGNLAHTTGQ